MFYWYNSTPWGWYGTPVSKLRSFTNRTLVFHRDGERHCHTEFFLHGHISHPAGGGPFEVVMSVLGPLRSQVSVDGFASMDAALAGADDLAAKLGWPLPNIGRHGREQLALFGEKT